jgi:archaellum component FlaF (FlaF/FlaG flagellin family)
MKMTMKMSKTTKIGAVLAGSVMLAASSAVAQSTFYQNNTANAQSSYTPAAGTEFGNEIPTAPIETDVTINSLTYEYSGAAANVDLKIYLNNGALINPGFPNTAAPGTLLYDSGTFALPGSVSGQTVSYGGTGANSLNVVIPAGQNFTWTVTFTGAAGSVGLDFYGPPSVGGAFNSILQTSGAGWQLIQNPGGISTFGAVITGVPEPTTYALAGLGLAALAFTRFGKRKTA